MVPNNFQHIAHYTMHKGTGSGGSSYEATEAGSHLSFWENANYYFFLRKRNQIRVSLYVSHNTNRYLHCVYLYTHCRTRYTTHQEPIRKLRLPVSASAAGPLYILAVPFHRNHGPSTEARPARVSPAPVLSTQLPRHQAANTAHPTMPWQWRSIDLF